MGKQDYISSDEDEKIVASKGKAALRKKRRNKPKDYPKRPLSAYNVFFKETREEIISTNSTKEGEKRDHKLDFQTMAKEIAARWKNLDKKERDRVDKLAKKDMLRYRDEVKVYEEEMVKKNREQHEEAAAKVVKQEQEAAAASLEKSRLLADRRAKEDEAQRVTSLGAGALMGGMPSSLDALGALANGRYQQGSDEAALQEALMWHQQREMIQRQLLLEELRAAEEREHQLRRLQSLGLLQGDFLSGLQAHQLAGLLGGQFSNAAMVQDHSGRGAGASNAAGLAAYLGGGAHSLLSSGLSPEMLLASSGGGTLQDLYNLQQQGLLQEHYARLLGGNKEAVGP